LSNRKGVSIRHQGDQGNLMYTNFIARILIIHSCQNLDYEEYRNEIKQKYKGQKIYLTGDDIHDVEHPCTFMKIIK
jgi:hypothetical protein